MENKDLMKYKPNFFSKISNFFKKILKKKEITVVEEPSYNTDPDERTEEFFKRIRVENDSELIRIKQLQKEYESGQIEEEDLSLEDVQKIADLYNKETQKLNDDTISRKKRIKKMVTELKNHG